MKDMNDQWSRLPEHELSFLGDAPVIYHCHHFNLFLDQTVDDALGPKIGAELRFAAARDASYQLLESLMQASGAETPAERMSLAEGVFAAMGHGHLAIDVDQGKGSARGENLHYGRTWFEKYGGNVRRRTPVDTFAAGFIAAAAELAAGLPRESVIVKEDLCIGMRASHCEFSISRGEPGEHLAAIDRAATEATIGATKPTAGLHEPQIESITETLRAFLAGVRGDQHGLIQNFGVYITLHLTSYYNRITYGTISRVLKTAPKMLEILESLFRESGHVCVFNTFGGILMSPEWEGAIGELNPDPAEIVAGCTAIARALNFGRWTIREHSPGQRLVIDTPTTYECPYYLTRHGRSDRPSCYFLQGAALAIMQLAECVNWRERPALDQEFYNKLFRSGVKWRVEQTQCRTMGQDRCEVVVSKLKGST